jgi:hypothetical protein
MANAQNRFDRASLVKCQSETRELKGLLVEMARLLTTKIPPNSQIQQGILIHSMLRVARSGEAQLLLSEGLYSEEMHCVNRALVEISINAAYLQTAVEAEIKNYLQYDAIAMAQIVQKMTTSMPKDHPIDKAKELEIRRLLALSKDSSGAIRSWTSKNITHRAREVDKATSSELMTMLLRVYEVGNSHVHGTADSVVLVGNWILEGENPNNSKRIESTIEALHGTHLCLLALSAFVEQRYQMGLGTATSCVSEAE